MQNKSPVFFCLFLFFFVSATIFWIFRNNLPPAWDQANYLAATETLYQSLIFHSPMNFLKQALTISPTKAPLMTFLPLPLYLIFGSSIQSALITNILVLFLFYYFFYKFIRLYCDQKTAFTSLIIVSLMPLFYGLLRQYFVEFLLTFFVISSVYFLKLSNHLTNKKFLIFLGITTGLGEMTKVTFCIFIIGPVLLELWNFYRDKNTKISILIKNLIYFLIPFLVITLPWYSKNILTVLWHAKRATDPVLLGRFYYGPPFSLPVIFHTLLDLINYGISGYFAIFIAILSLLLIKFKKIKYNLYLISYFFIPFFTTFFSPNKDYRFILPSIPLIAFFISWSYFQLLPKKGLTLLPLTLLLPILIFVHTTLVKISPLDNLYVGQILISNSQIGDYISRPNAQIWPINEVLETLNKLPPRGKVVITGSENDSFNINNLIYYQIKEHYNSISFKSASYFPPNTSVQTILSTINSGNYLIMKVGGNPGPWDLNRFNNEILSLGNWPQIQNNIIFPDGGRLLIYKIH